MASILVTVFVGLLILGTSYLVLLQPAYQPEDNEYDRYDVDKGIFTQNDDGSYTLHTENGDYLIPESEVIAMEREQFPIQNLKGGTQP